MVGKYAPPWRANFSAHLRKKILEAKVQKKKFWRTLKWSHKNHIVLPSSEADELFSTTAEKDRIENALRIMTGREPFTYSSEEEDEDEESQCSSSSGESIESWINPSGRAPGKPRLTIKWNFSRPRPMNWNWY